MDTIIEKRHHIIQNLMHTEDVELLDFVDEVLENKKDNYTVPINVQEYLKKIHSYTIENPDSVMSESEHDKWFAAL
jgi:hypothetical protein